MLVLTCICACSKQPKTAAFTTTLDYDKGESFLYRQNDSAFYYFNKVAASQKDSLLVALAYNNMAVIQSDAGDYFGAQESLLLSLQYLNEQKKLDYNCLSSDYNELGTSSLNLKNYDAALDYYNHALQFATDADAKTIALNDKAVAYCKKQQYGAAIAIYDSIINSSRNNKKEYARVLSNLANVKWLQNSGYEAAPELHAALQIRQDEQDDWGLNASYAHLADYYRQSRPDSALLYARKRYAVAQQLNSPDDELEALEKIIPLSAPGEVQQYFTRYHYLSDSLQTRRNAAKNQYALIRYDAEKNKADNLRLQKDNTEKRIQIILQRVFIGGIVVLLVIVLFMIIAWDRKRKQQSENAMRELRLKTSRKVHDVVANGLYQVMTQVEHNKLQKEQLLDEIEKLYEQSRDISYEQPEPEPVDYPTALAQSLQSFGNEHTKVLVVGNEAALWATVNDQAKKELKHVLQELMVNMRKHSEAQTVVVKFERKGNRVKIQYTDDGVGVPAAFSYGNGLTNTENRINSINGQINFTGNTPRGLKIEIHLPIA
ncbi:ATP-binding protein [Deminuibacter soli]|uniref:histidine kinase n=1 Tax=Deminuibacter soli TaxID=2291815 RepID=A0A3E1NFI1_9BACT|nr:ATP-binding protein [Deminuibacter soli]